MALSVKQRAALTALETVLVDFVNDPLWIEQPFTDWVDPLCEELQWHPVLSEHILELRSVLERMLEGGAE